MRATIITNMPLLFTTTKVENQVKHRVKFERTKDDELILSSKIFGDYCKRRLGVKVRRRAPHASGALVFNNEDEAVMETEEVTFPAIVEVTIRKSKMDHLSEVGLSPLMNAVVYDKQYAKVEEGVILQLVSTHTESDEKITEAKVSKETVLRWQDSSVREGHKLTYKIKLMLDENFGVPGAILVCNNYEKEFFLESIMFEGIVHFKCNSWIQPQKIYPKRRIFFTNKAYLPNNTPKGLQLLRENELMELRGDGSGTRRISDRIYDYDKYNDLGEPDKGMEHARPILGGENNPHPRRCRTGRPATKIDSSAESPVSARVPMYVPRDEQFSESKKMALELRKTKGILRNVIPQFLHMISEEVGDTFQGYSDINSLYKQQLQSHDTSRDNKPSLPLFKALKTTKHTLDDNLKFEPPKVIPRDSFVLRDDEFGRQPIAGMNSLNIEKLKVFPPKSKLNPSMYGPLESALTEEHIQGNLNGISVQQAIDENKLFILDYHDTYLPFLDEINSQSERKAHATRTIFFLTEMGTLKPVAIELSRTHGQGGSAATKQVLTPPVDATTNWLWQLAKAHVCANDAGAHQLVNHWLRTHACIEPFIIAAHRQLSVMHPIYKLIHPHMKYTLQVNAMARETLINAGGIIENDFTSGMYSMLLPCAAYRDWWRFDLEALPSDLIRRGLAIEDPSQPHGLKLLIEDFPYANDGLLIWSAIEELVKTYVQYYYIDPTQIQSDNELQNWYNEAINVGHEDHRDANWWPKLNTLDNLSSILTTLIWLASAQHAALNFGQYPYGGYIPTRPPLMRRLVPHQHDPEFKDFMANPQAYFLSSLPSLVQATRFIAVVDILSAHSPDEEYLGERDISTWSGDPLIVDAFYKFSMEMKRIERVIEERNCDLNLRNRCGAGVTPYELFIPSSGPGVTSKGVPNSITL